MTWLRNLYPNPNDYAHFNTSSVVQINPDAAWRGHDLRREFRPDTHRIVAVGIKRRIEERMEEGVR